MSQHESKEDKNLAPGEASVDVEILQNGQMAGTENADALRIIELPDGKWTRMYRSVRFQMLLLGVLSFSGPSMSDGE